MDYLTESRNNVLMAKQLLNRVKYYDLPEILENIKPPYSDGAFISMPIFHYLKEINAYDSHASGNEDFGIILKPIFGIPAGRFIMLKPIDIDKTEIHWLDRELNNIELEAISLIDYDFRFFELLGININKITVTMSFTLNNVNL